MMTRSLIQIATAVSRRLPLSQDPTTIVGNSDAQIRQLLELLQEEGEELVERHKWQVNYKDFLYTVTADPNFKTLPVDLTAIYSKVWRSGSNLTSLSGPTDPDDWHRLLTIPGVFPGYWRVADNQIQTIGVKAGETITFTYFSDNWVQSGASTTNAWQADSDTPLLPDTLFILGGRWRWKQSKGLEYAEDMMTYEKALEREIAEDRTASPINTSRQIRSYDQIKYTWPGNIKTT